MSLIINPKPLINSPLNSGANNSLSIQPSEQSNVQTIEIKPQLKGFFWAYVIFSLPGLLAGLLWLLVMLILVFGMLAGLFSGGKESSTDPSSKLSFAPAVGFDNSKASSDEILIYDLSGPITYDSSTDPSSSGINVKKVRADFEVIKKNTAIKNVVFRFNTPGGEVFASEILGDLIKDLANAKTPGQNAIFYFDQIVASGGLLATYKAPNYIIGSPYGETGSIGVVMHLPNLQGLAEKVGYSETVIKSTESKDIGNPLRGISDPERSYLQTQLDTMYNKFKSIVQTGRRLDPIKTSDLATGLVWFNPEAKEKGLLDEVGEVNQAVVLAAKNANVAQYSVKEIKKEDNFFKSLIGAQTIFPELNAINKINKTMNYKSGLVYAIEDSRI